MVDIVNLEREMTHRSTRKGALAAAVGALLALCGCAVSTPFRAVDPPPDGGTALRVVAVTHAVAEPGTRARFDAHTDAVIAALAAQPGLVGYRVRRTLLGDEVWTMTVWRSEADRLGFMAAGAHARAMADAPALLVSARFGRFDWPTAAAPPDWRTALERLDAAPRPWRPR